MVSLKFVNSQRALAERQQRIQGARVVGSQLGQENARRYRKAKEEQDVVVREELKNRFERLRDERLAEMENAWKGAREGVLTAAEAATAYEQSLAQRGHEEIAAWEAERQLEHQRHVIAVEKERTLREQHAIRVKATAARRERVRQLEAARSARVVQQSASSRIASPHFLCRWAKFFFIGAAVSVRYLVVKGGFSRLAIRPQLSDLRRQLLRFVGGLGRRDVL